MSAIKLEINLNDIVENMFCEAGYDEDFGCQPARSFNEEVRKEIVISTSDELKKQISIECLEKAKDMAREMAREFVDRELEGIILRKLRSGNLKTRWKGFESFDDLISERLDQFDIGRLIQSHIDDKASRFTKELKARYDNVFAAKVVQNLSDQKMLSPEISKILLGE